MSEPIHFRRTRIVRERDIDLFGHVNNAVWVRYVVELADAHTSAIGLDVETTRSFGGQWIVRRHELDYLRPALAGDEIEEETWIESLHGARSTRWSRFTRVSDDALLLSAKTLWAFVDPHTFRPRRIPIPVLRAYETKPKSAW